jgi:shikimate kinase
LTRSDGARPGGRFDRRPKRILLVGMMGAGKTTCGVALASRLGWRYLDSDAEIIRSTGMSVPDIFVHRGEPSFRWEESRVLAEATTSEFPAVVSVAGGAARDPDNRRRVRRAGFVVWLRAELSTLAHRVGKGEGRPLLGNDPAAALELLYLERMPLYRSLADHVVDVDRRTPGDVADEILRSLPRVPARLPVAR